MPELKQFLSAEALRGTRLPSNFLPAALPALQGGGAETASLVVTRDDTVEVVPIEAAVLTEPEALAGYLAEFAGDRSGVEIDVGPPAAGPFRLVLAPPGEDGPKDPEHDEKGRDAPLGGTFGGRGALDRRTRAAGPDRAVREAGRRSIRESIRRWNEDRSAADEGRGARNVVVGLIDAGIAFWNDVFLSGGAQAFADVGALDVDDWGDVRRPPPARWLGPDRLRAWGEAVPTGARDHRARREVGGYLRQSAFAPYRGGRPLLAPDAPAHGTAMAALLLEGQRRAGRTDPLPMLGLELPQWVLADSTGARLSAVLDLAVRSVVERARALGGTDVVLLLAFGFTGPPEAHAAVRARLDATVALFAARGVNVDLVVPVGNHLRDHVHARVDGAATYGGPRLRWQVVRDDHSVNTIDVILPDARPAGIEMLAPGDPEGAAAVAALEPGGVWLLMEGGAVIGGVRADELPDGRLRVRASLAATAEAPGETPRRPTARAGAWRIGFPGHEALEAWVMRDDAPFDDGRLPPRRQSWFADPLHRESAAIGVPAIADPPAPRGPVRRHGTVSPLAAAPMDAVTARWETVAGLPGGPAPYAGLAADGGPGGPALTVDRPGPEAGTEVVASGSPRRWRLSGTSAAAALAAGIRAADLAR